MGNEETAFPHRGQLSKLCIRMFIADAHQKQSSQITNNLCSNSAAVLAIITAASSLDDILHSYPFSVGYNITLWVFFI